MLDVRKFSRRFDLASVFHRLALGTLSLTLAPTVAVAQDASPPTGEEIVVEGDPDVAKAGRELAQDVTRKLRTRTPLERFHEPVCPFVIGADETAAKAIEQRIKENARNAGLEVGGEGCAKNLLIGFVPNARDEVTALIGDKKWAFGQMTRRDRKKLESESGPTRAWQVVVSGDENGQPLVDSEGPPINTAYYATRLRSAYTVLIDASVVLIELAAADGKTIEQIADFATMRGLVPVNEIDADAHAINTILSLFSGNSEEPGLTPFDRDYLKGYYSPQNEMRSGRATMFDIGKRYARPGEDPEE